VGNRSSTPENSKFAMTFTLLVIAVVDTIASVRNRE
jgi:hypothetical protein